jgi:hypothetical protein
MSDNKLALILFDIGFVAMLISMVTGPFGITDWSLTSGAAACILALASLNLAFQNLDPKPYSNKPHGENSGRAHKEAENLPKAPPRC